MFLEGRADLIVAEAMVTGAGKPVVVDGGQDTADAWAAARRLQELLDLGRTGSPVVSAVDCAPHGALNLAAVALHRGGLTVDPAEWSTDVLVARVRPVLA